MKDGKEAVVNTGSPGSFELGDTWALEGLMIGEPCGAGIAGEAGKTGGTPE
jgi:hypothetical protein